VDREPLGMHSQPPRSHATVTSMGGRSTHLSRDDLTFGGGALFFLALLLGLIVSPELIQNVVLRESSEQAPLLKAGETFPLTTDSLVRPRLDGNFSLYESDGIWLLQGDGVVDFRLGSSDEASLLEIGIGTLPTETTINIQIDDSKEVSYTFAPEEASLIAMPMEQRLEHSLSVSCRITGRPVDLGIDIRDLCLKFLWLRLT